MNPQQSSVQLPPHLVERLLSSSGEAAWNDWDWRRAVTRPAIGKVRNPPLAVVGELIR
jgi:hypothetical protein